ncbi:MAG TPA: hypothetical protein VFW11_09950 [Cyclobacteriaceae bacterium]|nr:hypothetical protein [Cyclobacteriaceae bacterium]
MMFPRSEYTVSQLELFDAKNYPKVTNELNVLKQAIWSLPDVHKADIVISFLKDHKVKMHWVHSNPLLVELITSDYQPVSHTEGLFKSSHDNITFLADFERYVGDQLE